jgi:hypothetical protein
VPEESKSLQQKAFSHHISYQPSKSHQQPGFGFVFMADG